MMPQENANYEELLQIKQGSDSYVDSSAQTLPAFPKSIEVQANPPATSEAVRGHAQVPFPSICWIVSRALELRMVAA
jgi:dynein intermediate chain 4, axonemal